MPRFLLVALALVVAGCDSVGDGDPEIVRYTGPPITEANATVPNDPFEPAGWDGLVFQGRAGVSVLLDRSTTCGDERARTVRLHFSDTAPVDGFPDSVVGTVEVAQSTPDGIEIDTLALVRVEIQDWGPDVYSGVAVGVESNADIVPLRLVFWADDLGTAVE